MAKELRDRAVYLFPAGVGFHNQNQCVVDIVQQLSHKPHHEAVQCIRSRSMKGNTSEAKWETTLGPDTSLRLGDSLFLWTESLRRLRATWVHSRGVFSKINLAHVLWHRSEMWTEYSKHALSKELLLKHVSTQSKMLKLIYLHVPVTHSNCEVKCINEKPLSTVTVVMLTW